MRAGWSTGCRGHGGHGQVGKRQRNRVRFNSRGKCRVRRRAERVSRPAREKNQSPWSPPARPDRSRPARQVMTPSTLAYLPLMAYSGGSASCFQHSGAAGGRGSAQDGNRSSALVLADGPCRKTCRTQPASTATDRLAPSSSRRGASPSTSGGPFRNSDGGIHQGPGLGRGRPTGSCQPCDGARAEGRFPVPRVRRRPWLA